MKSIGLVGLGVSNMALLTHFLPLGYKINVHLKDYMSLPSGVNGIFGENYLYCDEDVVFRSPSVRPDSIISSSRVLCESEYSLSRLSGIKICITGADGKTTTTSLIGSALSSEHSTLVGGNIGIPLASGLGDEHDFVVCELSSFQLMDFCPECEVAVITSITPNHLNWHSSMDEYIGAKLNVLKNARRSVLCYDYEVLRAVANEKTTLFSLSDLSSMGGNRVYLRGEDIYFNSTRVINKNELLLRGDFNILNVMATIGACYEYVSFKTLYSAIKEFKGVAHRLEFVKTVGGVSFFNSSIDTTPSRTLATLSAFDKEKTIVILGGQGKGLSYECLSEPLSALRGAILLGECKYELLPHIKCKAYVVSTLAEAVKCAYSIANRGDSVVLSPACTSFDMFESYKARGNEFCKIVNEINGDKKDVKNK